MLRILFVLAPLWLFGLPMLGGCASPALPYQPDKMSADQLKALIADKSAAAACSRVQGPWGNGVVVSVNLDRGTVPAGMQVEIGADCVTKIGGSK